MVCHYLMYLYLLIVALYYFCMKKEFLLKKLAGFFKELSEKDRVGVLVHCDPDGLASGVIISKAVLQHTGKEPHSFACSPYGGHNLMEKKLDIFRFARCNKLILADLSFDQDDFFVSKAEEIFDAVLFIDHHKVYNDFNSEKTIFIKASFFSEIDSSQYPASKLCFDLLSKHADLKKAAWVACVGILGDASGLQWKEFIEQTIKEGNFSFKEIDDCKEIIESVGLIEPYRFSDLFRLFLKAKGPEEILKSGFSGKLIEMRSEISLWLEKFEKEKEFFPEIELIWFECKPRIPIKTPLVNKISFELHPKKTVIFVQDLSSNKTHVSVSARRQDGKVKMNDLLENAAKNIPDALGGGHAPASGARVPRKFLQQFKQNIISELEKQYSKK